MVVRWEPIGLHGSWSGKFSEVPRGSATVAVPPDVGVKVRSGKRGDLRQSPSSRTHLADCRVDIFREIDFPAWQNQHELTYVVVNASPG
jgi:hypothetical protein